MRYFFFFFFLLYSSFSFSYYCSKPTPDGYSSMPVRCDCYDELSCCIADAKYERDLYYFNKYCPNSNFSSEAECWAYVNENMDAQIAACGDAPTPVCDPNETLTLRTNVNDKLFIYDSQVCRADSGGDLCFYATEMDETGLHTFQNTGAECSDECDENAVPSNCGAVDEGVDFDCAETATDLRFCQSSDNDCTFTEYQAEKEDCEARFEEPELSQCLQISFDYCFGGGAGQGEQLEQANDNLEDLKNSTDEQTEEAKKTNDKLDDTNNNLTDLKAKADATNNKLDGVNNNLSGLRDEVGTLTDSVGEMADFFTSEGTADVQSLKDSIDGDLQKLKDIVKFDAFSYGEGSCTNFPSYTIPLYGGTSHTFTLSDYCMPLLIVRDVMLGTFALFLVFVSIPRR
jgi:archaellum component FlaC